MDIYERRQKIQQDRHAARVAATGVCAATQLPVGVVLHVSDHAHVHVCEGGAFVEVTLWLPEVSGDKPSVA